MRPLLDPVLSPRLAFWLRYLTVALPAHLAWEFAQMPLYTTWETESARTVVAAVLHCTAGDVLIAAGTLELAVIGFGKAYWPARNSRCVAIATILLGVAYTVFSEWLNTEIREAWAYRTLMPLVPPLGTGLTPLLQWIVVPGLALWWAQWKTAAPHSR